MRYYRPEGPYGVKRLQSREQARRHALSVKSLAIVLFCAASLLLLGFSGARVVNDARSVQVRLAVVQKGDTLWDIAARVGDSSTDIRRLVYEIRKINSLQGTLLRPGDVLKVPMLSR